jgi:GntR family transcriptional regulator, transcriptional repressor for pyruvate dehydrogenase complex
VTVELPGDAVEPIEQYRIRPFSPVSRQDEVAIRIREYITENGLHPGDRLPGEAWFASQLNVGRPLVREALKGLEAVGVVEARKGVGRFVRAFEAESYLRHVSTDILIQSFSELDLIETRCVLEVATVGDAVARLTDEDIAEIDDLLDAMRTRASMGISFTEADLGLHKVIMSRADNRFITAMLDAVYAVSVERVNINGYSPEKIEQDMAEHEAIVRAVRGRDGKAARAALIAHFNTTARRLGFSPRWQDLFASGDSTASESS